jgi:hypothetical protein
VRGVTGLTSGSAEAGVTVAVTAGVTGGSNVPRPLAMADGVDEREAWGGWGNATGGAAVWAGATALRIGALITAVRRGSP